ncbi:hypothetical protein ACRAQ6_04905 [Erythrobacter sp. HA6-11]
MFEILAHGGEYIAITALCFSCWAAGRSVRSASPADTMSAYAENHTPSGPLHIAGASPRSKLNGLGSTVTPLSINELEQAPQSADQLHDMIRVGDLSDEGVLHSLVALAEASETKPVEDSGWRTGSSAIRSSSRCSEARILTRHRLTSEPLPSELADPLTPEVLSRYRVYAQECSPRV